MLCTSGKGETFGGAGKMVDGGGGPLPLPPPLFLFVLSVPFRSTGARGGLMRSPPPRGKGVAANETNWMGQGLKAENWCFAQREGEGGVGACSSLSLSSSLSGFTNMTLAAGERGGRQDGRRRRRVFRVSYRRASESEREAGDGCGSLTCEPTNGGGGYVK